MTTVISLDGLPPEKLLDGRNEPTLLPPELVEGVAMLQQAVALNDPNTLQTVWNCWDESQRSRLLAVVSDALKQQVLTGLGQWTATVGQWTRQVGEWVDEARDNLRPETRSEGKGEDVWEGQPL